MITRRQAYWAMIAGTASLFTFNVVQAADRTSPLEEQLKNGLRATRPEELQFIDRVVVLVETNKLSLRTVNAAFKWARQRRPDYPFPFFEQSLRVLASREGVSV